MDGCDLGVAGKGVLDTAGGMGEGVHFAVEGSCFRSQPYRDAEDALLAVEACETVSGFGTFTVSDS